MSNAIASMLQDNPKECVALMLKDSKGDASWNLTKSFELWTGYDAKGAYDWFMTHQSDLNQAQKSAAAMGFFVKAIESGELEGATTWNKYITDPRIKKISDQVLNIKAGK
jgi:hypothetical protein